MPEIVRRSEPKAAIRCRWPYDGIHYSAGRRGEAMDTDVRSVGNCSVDLSAQFGRSPSRSRVHGKLPRVQLTVKPAGVDELAQADGPDIALGFADAGVRLGLPASGSTGR